MTTLDQMTAWVEAHRAQGHDAHFTVAGAPGTGRGTWCFTCREDGPDDIRILTPEEVR